MERQTNQLIAARDDVLITETAGHRQRKVIILWLFNEMQHLLKLILNLRSLAAQTLGKQNSELRRINSQNSSDYRSIHPLCSGGNKGMTFLSQGPCNQFNEMDRHHRDMATAENGDTTLPLVLQQGKLLSKGVDLVKRRKIEGSAQ